MRKSRMPLVVTSAYMLAGAGWIVMGYFFSSALGDQATSLFELYKGLAFIAVTATALFTALYYMDAPVAATGAPAALAAEFEKSLRKSERVRRWLPVTVGLALAILLGMLLLGLTWMRENNLREGEASADALRHAIAEHTGTSLRIIDLTLSAIAQDMTAGMPSDPDVDLRRRLQVLDPLVRALWIIDGQGLITHATGANLSGMDLSGRSYFLHHRQQKNSGIFIDTPLHSLVRGTWFISVSRAARSASGQFLGVVVAALDPEQFGRHWQMPMPGNATSVALFNRDGVLLMRSPHQADAIGKSFHDTHAWRELVPRQTTGTYRAASNIDGKQRIYAFGRVPDYPLEIFIGIPKDQVLSGWYGFAAISLGSYLMAGGALILLVFTLMRQIHKRLLLQRRAAELARYPLQNRNPVLSVGPDGRILFRNAAAENLILGTRNTPAGKQLDDFLCSAAIGKNHMLHELPIGERLFSVSCVPHLPGTCDIYLTDITKPRENEALLRLFADLPLIGLAITTPDMRTWVHFNDRLCEMLGYSRSQLAVRNWETLTHPEDFAEDLAWHDRLLRGKSEGYTLDKRLVCGNGAIIHALLNVQVLRHPDRSLQYLVYAVQDITERMQQGQLLLRQKNIYATLSETNEAIVRLRQRDTLFDSICRIAVDRAGFAFVWLELLDAASGTLRTVARCGEDQGYIDAIHVSAGGQQVTNHVPTGAALREGRCQITNNIAGSPAMQPWHEAARRAGVQSSGVFPVTQANKVIGTLNLYAREPGYFNPEIVALLEQMAADLSYALDFIANEEQRQEALNALKIAEQRWQFALEGGEHGAWEWDMRTNKVFYSHQWKVMLGYDDADISDTLDEWQLRVHPDDLEPLLQQVARHLRGETPIYVSEHRLRCKDGGYKCIQDRGRVIRRAADGAPLTMVGTHTDITARRETEQQLRESENKFKGLVEQSLVGIYILEGETLLYANPRAAEIFGHAAEKIIGQSIRQLVDESDCLLSHPACASACPENWRTPVVNFADGAKTARPSCSAPMATGLCSAAARSSSACCRTLPKNTRPRKKFRVMSNSSSAPSCLPSTPFHSWSIYATRTLPVTNAVSAISRPPSAANWDWTRMTSWDCASPVMCTMSARLQCPPKSLPSPDGFPPPNLTSSKHMPKKDTKSSRTSNFRGRWPLPSGSITSA